MSRTLRIGVAGPCTPRLFARDLDLSPEELPVGLGGTPVNHLVRAWLDAGHAVTLATLDPNQRGNDLVVHRGSRLTLSIGPYRPRRRARDAFLSERRAIAAGLLIDRPSVVSAHWSYEFALGAIETGVPTLVTVHDVPREIFRIQPTPYRAVRWLMHRAVMRRATQIAFNSPYTRDALNHPRAHDGLILPNALPDAMFSLPDRPAPDPAFPKFVSVNNGFGPLKNVGALLEGFGAVRRKVGGASLELIGKGFEIGGPANQWASKRGLGVGTTFAGSLTYEEVLARIASCDVLVHPSLEESFGYTLIEAASLGTPVIAGRDSGAVPWVLAEGRAGRLVSVTNSGALAAEMLWLVTNVEEWRKLRGAAFDLARTRFAASKVAEAYVLALRALAT